MGVDNGVSLMNKELNFLGRRETTDLKSVIEYEYKKSLMNLC